MENKRNYILGFLLLMALSFGAGYYATPNKVKIETKEVVKTITVKEESKVKIVYKERITKPDGTIIEKEDSREDSNSKENSSSESIRTASKESTKDIGITLNVLAMVDPTDFSGKREYGVYVNKRVFSNIVVGAMATTDKKVGLSLGISF